MTWNELIALLPFLVLGGFAILTLLAIAALGHRSRRPHALVAGLALLGLALSVASLPLAASVAPLQVTALLRVDGFALFFLGLLFSASFAVAAFSYGYLKRLPGEHEAYYLLLLLAALGAGVLAASTHFASFFLGLELLSVGLYGMIAYLRTTPQGIEAGLKYLILAGASSAFLLFGMALVYASQGTMAFSALALSLVSGAGDRLLLLAGLGMLVVGFGFKLAVVPFHMWVADVYEGAPAPVAAFVATVSKGAVFALLLRFFLQFDLYAHPALFWTFALVAIASMLAGNLLALLQDNVKRLLAYSSIAHLGYMLVAFLAGGDQGAMAASFYLVAYVVTILGAFGVVSLLSSPRRDADALSEYRSLFWRQPWLAGVFTATLLSLAGIPLTAGFTGKFYILVVSVGSAVWSLAIILVLSSVIGLYYYLRVIVVMFLPQEQESPAKQRRLLLPLPLAGGAVLIVLALLLVGLGIYPSPLVTVIRLLVAGVAG
jgi:NADH-quinone oxidoreductase subunit N